ncbi:hypothetical protein N0V94_004115 [Neodidymelliopsis sp. IMI 364377]|nr:hypothetical protein N0V94_004115 [Neodidymelliopsis sp. IMI 364377]
MHIRLATPSDEPAIVSLLTSAFFNEDLFGRVIHPHRALYPDDVRIFWHESVRNDWASSRARVIVAVEKRDNAQDETVLGAAIWIRQGDDAGAHKVCKEWTDPGVWPALESTHNRALDPERKDILRAAAPFTEHYWAGMYGTGWYLGLCAVNPSFAGRGCGRLLVRWGLGRAEDEGVFASVMASEGSDDFYLKCGFDKVVGNANEGEGNPLKELDVKGGNILFMWPKSGGEQKAP